MEYVEEGKEGENDTTVDLSLWLWFTFFRSTVFTFSTLCTKVPIMNAKCIRSKETR